MKRHSLFFLILVFGFAACGPRQQTKETEETLPLALLEDANQQAFFNNLYKLCGQSFAGREVFMIEENESWAHLDFVMHVTECGDDRILIPFHLSEDHSRTWMFVVEEGKLRFRHDHRHEDGTPDEVTLYGGYATREGTAFVQHFPADDYTCQLIPYACNNEWIVEIAEDFSSFTYKLTRDGVLRFEAAFDLTQPIQQE
ncbi:MAG: hypothetical protein V2I46_09035 [Bacteroides sp.]|jgi:hypothetical protein|nr:hypothetical protein [Bacteroides sp.]